MTVAKPVGWDEMRGALPSAASSQAVDAARFRPSQACAGRSTVIERAALGLIPGAALAVSLLLGDALVSVWRSPRSPIGVRIELVLFATMGLSLLLVQWRGRPTRLVVSFLTDFRRTGTAVAIGTLTAVLVAPFLEPDPAPSSLPERLLVVALPALLVMPWAHRLRVRAAHPSTERVVVVGSGSVAEAISRRLVRHRTITLVGIVDDLLSDSAVEHVPDLATWCQERAVDRVVVAVSATAPPQNIEVLRQLDPRICISVVPPLIELCSWNVSVEEFDGLPVLHIPRPRLTPSGRAVKRTLDLIVAGAVLVLLSPLLVVLAAGIKLDSSGPVFFRQARTGQGGRTFMIVKFRTMRTNAESERAGLAFRNEADGPIFKMRDDPRVTRMGRWLRRTSLDELPQLLNVLTGDMSLVGPRPFPVEEAAQLSDWSVPRTDVRPGITGLWQVSGRSDLSLDDLHHLDSVYVAGWSIWWDLRILLRTPPVLLSRSGAY